MWILFSPSEKKCLKHKKEQRIKKESQGEQFYQNFICRNGLDETLKAYIGLLQGGKEAEIKQIFGVKNIVLEELALAQNLMDSPLLPAVLRYVGVAFESLDFEHLSKESQDYLNQHLLIFSNLFGLLRANDRIPYYDLKQGERFQWKSVEFETKKFYVNNAHWIWEYLANYQVKESHTSKNLGNSLEFLDLRAGFYQKCLTLDKAATFFHCCNILVYEPNFIKNGKVISHYAKHYRGILLRVCAQEKLTHLEDLENLYIEALGIGFCSRDTK